MQFIHTLIIFVKISGNVTQTLIFKEGLSWIFLHISLLYMFQIVQAASSYLHSNQEFMFIRLCADTVFRCWGIAPCLNPLRQEREIQGISVYIYLSDHLMDFEADESVSIL